MIKEVRTYSRAALPLLLFAVLLCTCSKEEGEERPLSLLGITVNGISLVEGTVNVPVDASIELSFSAALNVDKFESAFSLSSAAGPASTDISFANASSKAIVSAKGLEFNTAYQLKVAATDLGQQGEVLDKAIAINFTTIDGGEITEMDPCVSASPSCLQTAGFANGQGVEGSFDFYSSYPAYLDNARWVNLKNAVIVTHGQNRDADNYFAYLMTTLRNEGLEGSTILIAPFFKNGADAVAGDLYWSTAVWREGQNSSDGVGISSFEVVDQLIARLADKAHFPVMEKLLITGHSSGALFTHVYAAANGAEARFPEIEFHYIVANSQYFYYPDEVRFDENTGQFTEPAGCPTFNHWPLGFVNLPGYLNGASKAIVDNQLIGRQITYLLGSSDTNTSGTLNTTDCEAVLLGSNRFKRGEHIFSLMESRYNEMHNHRKVIVNGVGHDAQGMYQSSEFRTLLREILQ